MRLALLMVIVVAPAVGLAAPPPPETTATPVPLGVPLLSVMNARSFDTPLVNRGEFPPTKPPLLIVRDAVALAPRHSRVCAEMLRRLPAPLTKAFIVELSWRAPSNSRPLTTAPFSTLIVPLPEFTPKRPLAALSKLAM